MTRVRGGKQRRRAGWQAAASAARLPSDAAGERRRLGDGLGMALAAAAAAAASRLAAGVGGDVVRLVHMLQHECQARAGLMMI